MNSGAIKASTTILKRRTAMITQLSSGLGILGWTAIQVHANKVTRQLQMIFQIVRQCCRSLQCSDVTSLAEMGSAWTPCLAKKYWRMRRVNMSILQGRIQPHWHDKRPNRRQGAIRKSSQDSIMDIHVEVKPCSSFLASTRMTYSSRVTSLEVSAIQNTPSAIVTVKRLCSI